MTKDFTHAGVQYQAGKLDAVRQFHVARRLAPFLPKFVAAAHLPGLAAAAAGQGASLNPDVMAAVLGPLAKSIAEMSDADAEYVLYTCLSVVERQQPKGGWARVMAGEKLMFEDMDLAAMLVCVGHVLMENLSGFFAALPSVSPGEGRT